MKYTPLRHIWTEIEGGGYISMVLDNKLIWRSQKTPKTSKLDNSDLTSDLSSDNSDWVAAGAENVDAFLYKSP